MLAVGKGQAPFFSGSTTRQISLLQGHLCLSESSRDFYCLGPCYALIIGGSWMPGLCTSETSFKHTLGSLKFATPEQVSL